PGHSPLSGAGFPSSGFADSGFAGDFFSVPSSFRRVVASAGLLLSSVFRALARSTAFFFFRASRLAFALRCSARLRASALRFAAAFFAAALWVRFFVLGLEVFLGRLNVLPIRARFGEFSNQLCQTENWNGLPSPSCT